MSSLLFNRILIFILTFSWSLASFSATAPNIEAESYILLDVKTGEVLLEKNADTPLPPASLTKIMSTYLYFQALKDKTLDMNQSVVISENAWASKTVGSKMFIEVNSSVNIADLLRGVIIQSGNDASIALAEAIAGDEDTFAALMNEEAKKMALSNSHFKNSTGLPADEHYSSARDMAIISRRTI